MKIQQNYQRSAHSWNEYRLSNAVLSVQAQQEHDDAKEVFDVLNDQLIAELPQLLDLRVPYFDPSFEAMIRMQSKFAEEGYEKLSGVQRYVTCIVIWTNFLTSTLQILCRQR